MNAVISPVTKVFYALGTENAISVYDLSCEDPAIDESAVNEAIYEAAERLTEIDDEMSVYKDGSDISKINHSAGSNAVQVSLDTWSVLKKAVEYGMASNGAIDVTIRPLTKLWGINDAAGSGSERDKRYIPDDPAIEEALKLVDFNDIVFYEETRSIMLRRIGQSLDLGGIAKGFAADEVKKILAGRGIRSSIVNLGGNVTAIGNRMDGQRWLIGIQDPARLRGEYMGMIPVSDRSVVTSASYERYFWDNGRRFHHIIDPTTGYPAERSVLSATVAAPRSIDADALSTCIFTMGPQKGMKFIRRLKSEGMDVDAVIICENGSVLATPGIRMNNGLRIVRSGYYFLEA